MTEEKSVEQRLDAQALAIKQLRARVKTLEDQVAGTGETAGATRSKPVSPVSKTSEAGAVVGTVARTGTLGVYVPNPCCLVCGTLKEAGRIELTCRACGRERQRVITEKIRPRPSYSVCGNCGGLKGPSMNLLDTQCSRAFGQWKTDRISGQSDG